MLTPTFPLNPMLASPPEKNFWTADTGFGKKPVHPHFLHFAIFALILMIFYQNLDSINKNNNNSFIVWVK